MTLDEAIEHAKEKGKGTSKCAKDHRQLAKWLIEFQEMAKPKTDDENELKFYYVESLDDYWVGRRLDNFYYATWHGRLGFVWSHSKYLPWGEHIVDENTLWKEHTYPSEPIEIPFTEWIVGFVKKYSAEPHNKDAISREGLLKSWEELSPRGRTEFDQVIMTIPALPSAEPKTGWIPVSERLPSDSGNYLITVADFRLGHIGEHTVTIADFYAKEKKWNSVVDVVAWMPLPEPYREDGEE